MAYADRPYTARSFEALQVGTQPIDDVTITFDAPNPIAGKIEIEQPAEPRREGDRAPVALPAAKVRVTANCALLGFFGVITTTTDEQGQFRIDNPAAGETYALTVTAPADTYITSLTGGDHELVHAPFPVTAGGGPVHILLKRDGGKIAGTIQKRDGVNAPAFVVLAPKDSKAEQFFRTATASNDGTFTLAAIAPGEYNLFAFDHNEEDEYFEDAYLRAYASKAIAVTIQPNSSLAFSLEALDALKGLRDR